MLHSSTFDRRSEDSSLRAIAFQNDVDDFVSTSYEYDSDGEVAIVHTQDADEQVSITHISIAEAPLEINSRRFMEFELLRKIESLEARNKTLEERGKQLAQELDIFRQRRLVYWSDRFRNKFDAWHMMHPAFEEVKDDTIIFQGDLKSYRLLPSVNLVRTSSMRYELNLRRAGLSSILVAPIVDMPSRCGEICLRLIGPNQNVEREVSIPLSDLSEESPCEFKFTSLGSLSEERLTAHIFVQNVDVPVRIFELRSYPLFGFARLKRKMFAGFRFTR
jgi:hypothetical protein